MSAALRIAVLEEMGNVPVTILHVSADVDSKTYQDLESKAVGLIGVAQKTSCSTSALSIS